MKKLILSTIVIFLITCSCTNYKTTDKVLFYRVDTNFYKSHPRLYPLVTVKHVDSLFNDLNKKGKQLTEQQVNDLEDIISNSTFHDDKDCATIWKDGVLVFYNRDNTFDKFVIVSMDCYDLVLYHDNKMLDKINLNEKGQKFLFTLFD